MAVALTGVTITLLLLLGYFLDGLQQMWNMENKTTTVERGRGGGGVVSFACFEAVVFKMVYCNMWYTGPGMNLQILSHCLSTSHTCGQKTLRGLCWLLPPHYAHTCILSLHAEDRVNKRPSKKMCYYLNSTADYRSRKARSQWLPQLYFKSGMCFESGTANDTKNKESRVMGSYLKFFWPPSSPTLPQQMLPMLVRGGTLYRGFSQTNR